MRNMKNYIHATFIAFMAFAQPLHAQSKPSHDPAKFTHTFTWSNSGDARSLDPVAIYEVVTINVLENVYEPLDRRNDKLELEPCLATEWKQIEPKKWRFKLREGVKFQDGKPFTSKDVVFTYKRAKSDKSDLKGVIVSIKDVVAVDPMTVDFITYDVDPILPRKTTDILIMSEDWCKENKCELPADANTKSENFATRNANGTGPFKVVSREPDVATKFAVNLDWWDNPTHNLKEATFKPIQAATTRISGLLSGDLDFIYPVPIQDIKRLKSTPGISVLEGNELLVLNLFFNLETDELRNSKHKGPNPLKDIRVRKAINMAIDKNAIAKTVMRGYAAPTSLIYGDGISGYDKSIDTPHLYSVEEAKKLLTEAGYPNGFELTLNGPNDRYINDEHICVALSSMLQKIGIKLTVQTETKSKYFPRFLTSQCDFWMMGWFPGTYDAHDSLENLAATFIPNRQGAYNLGKYSNPKYDEIVIQVGRETDPKKRQTLINQASEILKNDLPIIPLHQQKTAWGMKKNVKVTLRPDNFVTLRSIKIES